jgi:hypothetical protein
MRNEKKGSNMQLKNKQQHSIRKTGQRPANSMFEGGPSN